MHPPVSAASRMSRATRMASAATGMPGRPEPVGQFALGGGATVGQRWVFGVLHDRAAEAAGIGQRARASAATRRWRGCHR